MKVVHLVNSSHSTIEVELADWRGTPIEVGSRVIYAATAGAHSVEVYEAEIIDLQIDNNEFITRSAEYLDKKMIEEGYDQELYERMIRYLCLGFKAKGRVVSKSGGFRSWDKQDRITTFKKNDRITVIK